VDHQVPVDHQVHQEAQELELLALVDLQAPVDHQVHQVPQALADHQVHLVLLEHQ
jgi:hypothetical protein